MKFKLFLIILCFISCFTFIDISAKSYKKHSYTTRKNYNKKKNYNKSNYSTPRFFSKEMRLRKYKEQNGICPHCNKQFPFSDMEGDHIIPYSKGGKTTWDNLQMLCRACNRKKGNRYSY